MLKNYSVHMFVLFSVILSSVIRNMRIYFNRFDPLFVTYNEIDYIYTFYLILLFSGNYICAVARRAPVDEVLAEYKRIVPKVTN